MNQLSKELMALKEKLLERESELDSRRVSHRDGSRGFGNTKEGA